MRLDSRTDRLQSSSFGNRRSNRRGQGKPRKPLVRGEKETEKRWANARGERAGLCQPREKKQVESTKRTKGRYARARRGQKQHRDELSSALWERVTALRQQTQKGVRRVKFFARSGERGPFRTEEPSKPTGNEGRKIELGRATHSRVH